MSLAFNQYEVRCDNIDCSQFHIVVTISLPIVGANVYLSASELRCGICHQAVSYFQKDVEVKGKAWSPSFIDIGPECFSDMDRTVICWKGENFYRACDAVVISHTLNGGRTHCVKRVGHPGEYHEDFDGNVIISFQALVEVKNATFKVGEMCSVHSLVHNFSLPNDEGWYVCVPGGVVTKDGWFSEVDDSNG